MKRPKQAYTAGFKERAVKRIKDGHVGTICQELGWSDQTLRNWAKAAVEGKLNGAGGRVVPPEAMELSRLRAENLRRKRENEILKKSDDGLRQGGSVKSAWIAAQNKSFSLAERRAVLDVSIHGYRAWKRGGAADRKRWSNRPSLALMRALPAGLQGAYGSPRRVRELRARGCSARQERVGRLMRDHGLRARHKRRDQVTTDSKPGLPVADSLLARNFTPTAPNPVWTSDMTSRWTNEGGLSLAIVRDRFNREGVGWSLKPRRTADIATDTLTMAWFRKRSTPGLLHPSDRGSQYASHAFQDKLKAYGMTCSMSCKGHCRDNAPMESGFNRFKNEQVQGVRSATPAEIKAAP